MKNREKNDGLRSEKDELKQQYREGTYVPLEVAVLSRRAEEKAMVFFRGPFMKGEG